MSPTILPRAGGIVRATSDDVRHSLLLERLLGLADHTDLWDCIDPGREYVGKLGSEVESECMANRAPPLFRL